jgi:hypothetical protein
VKSYLNLSPICPKWAKVTDIILDVAMPNGPNAQVRLNTFLQTWRVPSKGIRAEKMNDNIRRMLEASRNHNINLAVMRISHEIQNEMPAWLQIGSRPNLINNRVANCLLKKHKVKMIADLMKTSTRIRENKNDHRQINFCTC